MTPEKLQTFEMIDDDIIICKISTAGWDPPCRIKFSYLNCDHDGVFNIYASLRNKTPLKDNCDFSYTNGYPSKITMQQEGVKSYNSPFIYVTFESSHTAKFITKVSFINKARV